MHPAAMRRQILRSIDSGKSWWKLTARRESLSRLCPLNRRARHSRPPQGCQVVVLPLSLTCHVAMLATYSKNTAAAANSAQIVRFMAAEWCVMGARV